MKRGANLGFGMATASPSDIRFDDIGIGTTEGRGSERFHEASSISPTGFEELVMNTVDTAAATPAQVAKPRASSIFDRVVAGVDGSEPGFEAARQAARLVAADGWLEVFTAVYLVEANLAGWSATRIADELWQEGGDAIREATEIAGPRAQHRLVNGPPLQSLMHELREREATLAVVGTHGHSRLSEIIIGGVAGELLHNAPCSVLVARPPVAEALFPHSIVAGADGSPESAAAVAAAQYLANRFAAPLTVVTALAGKDVDPAAAELAAPVEVLDKHPVRALVEASANADILVVGSRVLHGLRSLGSVSERVAHQAHGSVLVVRAIGG
jgi:nucleotide-binding universal stress UspA family protein